MSPRFGSGQRGAIGLMAAGTMALALLFTLLSVDSGRLYLEKRKLQSVADTAALEAANRGGQCSAGLTTANDYARQNATRNGFTVVANDNSRGLAVTCGSVAPNAANIRVFTADATKSDAIRVVATKTVQNSVANGIWNLFRGAPIATQINMTATAVAAVAPPAAQLTIRSSLASVDSTKSALLNMVVGNLLGGSISLTAVGWNGLLQTNVNLLSYLDQLAIQLHVTAGDYDSLLRTSVSAAELIQAAVTVLQRNGQVVSAVINDVISIGAIAPNTKLLTVGDLLNVATGTPAAALNTTVQLFQLLQTVAQLSSSKSAVSAAVQLNIPLVGSVAIQTKVIEPPQMSSIGNPVLAKAGLATNTNQIYVRTGQVRTLVSIQAPVLKAVSSVASLLTGLGTPVSKVVKGLLSLDIPAVVGGVLCLVACDVTDVDITQKLDIYVEAASADARVTDFSCTTPATKSLTVKTTTSVATLGVGAISPTAAFSSSAPVDVQPVRLVDFGSRFCVVLTLLCNPNRTPGVGGGLLLKVQSTVGQKNGTLFFSPVAEMNAAPTYLPAPGTTDIIGSLAATLSGIQVTYSPPPGKTVSSGALAGVADLLTNVTTTLANIINAVLSPLLDPIVNTLLSALGINLGNAEVGANLSCRMGNASLVI